MKISKKYLQRIIQEETVSILKEDIKSTLGGENLIQDPIGGTLRPDQLKSLLIDDLRQCLGFAESDRWEFVSLLNNITLRATALKELYEDDDDEQNKVSPTKV